MSAKCSGVNFWKFSGANGTKLAGGLHQRGKRELVLLFASMTSRSRSKRNTDTLMTAGTLYKPKGSMSGTTALHMRSFYIC